MLRMSLLLFVIMTLAPPGGAQEQRDVRPLDVQPLDVQPLVEQLDQRIREVEQTARQIRKEAREVRKRAADEDRQWKSLLGQIEQLQDQRRKLNEQREAAKTAMERQQAADLALETARQEFEAAKKRLEEAEQMAAQAAEEAEAAAQPIDAMQTELRAREPELEPLREAAQRAEAESQEVRRRIAELEDRAASLQAQRDELQQKIETALREAGQWISFSHQIAPLFHQQCVACHNARNAEGGYNMATFAAVLAEGESGVAIEPGNAQASTLYQHVVDGWMPFEADPLDEGQIDLIRQWIELGARLDRAADPLAPLIRIMPRVAQPTPPELYRVPLPVTALATSLSGDRLASSGYHEVLIWRLPDGKLERRITNVAERVYALAFHPDAIRVAVASGTPGQLGEVKLFDSQSGELLADLLVSEDAMFDVAFSPDGSQLAACGADGAIAIFDVDQPTAPRHLIANHADWVQSIDWSPDGRWLVSASRDKTSKVFNAETGELHLTFSGHQQNVTVAIFSADGKRVISGGDDQRLRVWTIDEGKQLSEIGGFSGSVTCLSRFGEEQVISAGADRHVRLHQLSDGKLIHQSLTATDWISSLALTADRSSLFVGDQSGQLHRIDCDRWESTDGWTAAPNKPLEPQ